ncbi:MAG: sulfite exporter TauE/SafE family protein [Chloroflexota bacterium]|nr:MAG: sulfite exporter TauE/SafE family protein [Chloroflexota bacterium]
MNLPYDLAWWAWAIAILGALLIGISKTGVAGLGVFAVALYALIFPARASTGIVLPILLVGDIVAVAHYRRDAVWSHLLRLLPWTGLGVVLGYFALGSLDSAQVGRLIGIILLIITGLQFWRMRSARAVEQAGETLQHKLWLAALVGILAGFFTMVSNASGPIMIIYFLAMGLPKIEFMGTSAWYYLIMNSAKVPFSYNLGLITPESLVFDAFMAPFVIVGGLLGYQLLKRINQQLFEQLALIFTALAAIRLILG